MSGPGADKNSLPYDMELKIPKYWRELARARTVAVALSLVLSAVAVACGSGGKSPAPDFEMTLYDRAGADSVETASLSDYRGQPVVLNFWATWCAPCRAEMPLLEEMHKRFEPDGLVMLGVDMGVSMQPDQVTSFLDEAGVTYEIGFPASASVGPDYGVVALPATVFIDSDGNINRTWVGILDKDGLLQQIERIVES